MKTYRSFALNAIAFGAALGAGSAQAVDFDGYFRAGPGLTSQNAARACYNLVWCPRNNWRFGFLSGPRCGAAGFDLLQGLPAP